MLCLQRGWLLLLVSLARRALGLICEIFSFSFWFGAASLQLPYWHQSPRASPLAAGGEGPGLRRGRRLFLPTPLSQEKQ